MPSPKRIGSQIAVLIPPRELEAARALAARLGMPLAELVRRLLRRAVANPDLANLAPTNLERS